MKNNEPGRRLRVRIARQDALREAAVIAERIRCKPEPEALDGPVSFQDGWELACERVADAIRATI